MCSLFVALMVVGAFIKIPVPVVPFTYNFYLQWWQVFCLEENLALSLLECIFWWDFSGFLYLRKAAVLRMFWSRASDILSVSRLLPMWQAWLPIGFPIRAINACLRQTLLVLESFICSEWSIIIWWVIFTLELLLVYGRCSCIALFWLYQGIFCYVFLEHFSEKEWFRSWEAAECEDMKMNEQTKSWMVNNKERSTAFNCRTGKDQSRIKVSFTVQLWRQENTCLIQKWMQCARLSGKPKKKSGSLSVVPLACWMNNSSAGWKKPVWQGHIIIWKFLTGITTKQIWRC